jgi:hypothetical protein
MGEGDLNRNVQSVSSAQQYSHSQISQSDPESAHYNKISPEDLKVMREKFPQLTDFSEQFLQSRILEELLRIESTSLRIRDSERQEKDIWYLTSVANSFPARMGKKFGC